MLRVFQFVQSARVARTKCGEIATRQLHALRLKRRSIRPGKVDQAVALRVAKIFARAEQHALNRAPLAMGYR